MSRLSRQKCAPNVLVVDIHATHSASTAKSMEPYYEEDTQVVVEFRNLV